MKNLIFYIFSSALTVLLFFRIQQSQIPGFICVIIAWVEGFALISATLLIQKSVQHKGKPSVTLYGALLLLLLVSSLIFISPNAAITIVQILLCMVWMAYLYTLRRKVKK
ncbi:Na+/melibiose symporter-like transporter [Paenibacillus sp. BK720]|nr:Na+/melibiose symporter-like transporter [Paenibacillus sp. BK720]